MRLRTFRILSSSRLGYRGAILFILGTFDLAYGASFFTPGSDTSTTAHWRETFMPLWAWGGAWLAVGALALFYAFSQRDEVGYTVQCVWLAGWCVISFLSSAFGEVPRGWVSGILFLAPLAVGLVCNTWAEPPKVETVTALEIDADEEDTL